MNLDPLLNLNPEQEVPPLEKRILAAFRRSKAFWCCNTAFQLLFTPVLITLFVRGRENIGLILLFMLAIPMLISIGQRVFHRRIIYPLLDEYEGGSEGVGEFVAKLKRRLRINALCCVPVFGILTSFCAAKIYCMLDMVRFTGGSLINN